MRKLSKWDEYEDDADAVRRLTDLVGDLETVADKVMLTLEHLKESGSALAAANLEMAMIPMLSEVVVYARAALATMPEP